MPSKKDVTIGLDIGYSGVKWAFQASQGGHATTAVMPAGACKSSELQASQVDGAATLPGVSIQVAGTEWRAGLNAAEMLGKERELDERYIESDSYKALFHAALKKINRPEVDRLVTGLPVKHFKRHRDQLQKLFTGRHEIDQNRKVVQVREVVVVPQPVGAFFSTTMTRPDEMGGSKVLVLDPGWFSFDFVVVDQNKLRPDMSGMSTDAMSRVCEYAAQLATSDLDFEILPKKIELALLKPKPEIMVAGEKVNAHGYISDAVNRAWDTVKANIGKTLRSESTPPDVVLLAGGGASFFNDPVKQYFPKSKVVLLDDPLYANAQGFLAFASVSAKKAQTA